MNEKKQLIKIEIPNETTNKMLKKQGLNKAVGIIADVVSGMQSDIEKGLSYDKDNKK